MSKLTLTNKQTKLALHCPGIWSQECIPNITYVKKNPPFDSQFVKFLSQLHTAQRAPLVFTFYIHKVN